MNFTNNTVQWRHEYKYLCNPCQQALLQARVESLLQRDAHVNSDGVYRIRSLYLDGIDNPFFWDNENGFNDREKYRIRIYNEDSSRIVLEKKSKKNGMNHKESCIISEEICRIFMEGEQPNIHSQMPGKLKKLLLEVQCKALRPVVIVEYERTPFVEENGNVRITFDQGISSSFDFSSFLEARIVSRPILKTGWGIMEVKWDSHLPDYIKRFVQLDTLKWTTFSKYYLCRKYNYYGGSIL